MPLPSAPTSYAVGDLYNHHSNWLQQWMSRRFGGAFNSADVSDLTHDTFVKLLVKPRNFSGQGEARSFLCTVARGLCIDQWRRRQLEQAWLEELAAMPENVEPSPEFRAILLQTLHEIDEMLDRLPTKARNAFLLSQLSGKTYREIAAELGVGERMIKKYIAQAMYQCMLKELSLMDSEA